MSNKRTLYFISFRIVIISTTWFTSHQQLSNPSGSLEADALLLHRTHGQSVLHSSGIWKRSKPGIQRQQEQTTTCVKPICTGLEKIEPFPWPLPNRFVLLFQQKKIVLLHWPFDATFACARHEPAPNDYIYSLSATGIQGKSSLTLRVCTSV
jgi:hypothetical protein